MQLCLVFPAVVSATAAVVSASLLHIIPGEPEAVATQHHRRLLRRAGFTTNEAQFAQISDATQACAHANAEGMGQLLKQNVFPKADHIASIQQGDSEAQQVWQDIQNSNIIPSDVQVKQDNTGGQHYGVDDSSYNSDSDPDCWWTASGCKKPKHSNIPQDLYQCPEPNTWGLTFDDGPNCSHNAFYDFLQQNNLKATMFYIGSNVVNWPLQAQRGIVDGHDICLHTWSHRYMTTLSNEQVFAELYYTAKAIKIATGVTPTCWRPPFGDTDDRVRAIAAGLGLRTILWEEDTDDWNITPSGDQPTQKIDQNYQKIISKASSESPIVLTHEIDQYTMGEFQKMFGQVKDAYKNVVPVSACQNVTHPYPEDVTYPAFSQYINGDKATGLPDGNSIQVNASATYTPVALSQQKTGFAVTNQSVSTTNKDTNGTRNGNSSSTSSHDQSASDSQNKNSNSALSVSAPHFSTSMIVFAATLFASAFLS